MLCYKGLRHFKSIMVANLLNKKGVMGESRKGIFKNHQELRKFVYSKNLKQYFLKGIFPMLTFGNTEVIGGHLLSSDDEAFSKTFF